MLSVEGFRVLEIGHRVKRGKDHSQENECERDVRVAKQNRGSHAEQDHEGTSERPEGETSNPPQIGARNGDVFPLSVPKREMNDVVALFHIGSLRALSQTLI